MQNKDSSELDLIPSRHSVSIVVPCYNEEEAIVSTVEQIRAAIPEEMDAEIIVINDGSSDRTSEVLAILLQADLAAGSGLPLKVINHKQNRGYGAALKTGIRAAAGEYIAITDADGTYPNDRLKDLITECYDADMVVGARTAPDVEYSRVRRIPKLFLRLWASWIARQDIPDINSGMRVFRTAIAQKYFGILPEGFSFTLTITLAMLTNFRDVKFIPITYRSRIGKSKIKPIRDTLTFMSIILRTGIYFAPLRAFSPICALGVILFTVSILYDMIVLGNLTDKSILILVFTLNTVLFALLADMIDKRTQE